MERRLTEEQITKAILDWLEMAGWEIIAYDFPQSGTGISLHQNKNLRTTKNKGSIIPDIVAIKGFIAVFFENKDRFVLDDFLKILNLKNGKDYEESINKIVGSYHVSKIYYGIGLPNSVAVQKGIESNSEKIDFAICVNSNKSIIIQYQSDAIFNE